MKPTLLLTLAVAAIGAHAHCKYQPSFLIWETSGVEAYPMLPIYPVTMQYIWDNGVSTAFHRCFVVEVDGFGAG